MFDMKCGWADIKIMKRILQRGIDSRLDGFTQSKFKWNSNTGKLECKIHPSEMQVLIRRLLEDDTEEAEMLADDIVMVEYGYEM